VFVIHLKNKLLTKNNKFIYCKCDINKDHLKRIRLIDFKYLNAGDL